MEFIFKIKTEPFMQTITIVVAIISLAGIVISTASLDRVTNTTAIAAITALALVLRLQ